MSKRWAIIEFENSHFECMHTVAHLLNHLKYDVHYFVPRPLADRMEKLSLYKNAKIHFISRSTSSFHILKTCRTHKISYIFFNSAQGKKVFKLIALAVSGFQFSGFIHHPKKYLKSLTQKFIQWKLTNKYVLAPHLSANNQYQVLEPFFFPSEYTTHNDKKNDSIFQVVIPGQVEFKRRDYNYLMNEINADINFYRKNKVQFLCLGPAFHEHGDGGKLQKLIETEKLGDVLEIYSSKGILEDVFFHRKIQEADCLLPLIHPGKKAYSDYFDCKFSGTFALSAGHMKPMLLASEFKNLEGFRHKHFFYGNLQSAIIEAMNPEEYDQKQNLLKTQRSQFLKNLLGNNQL